MITDQQIKNAIKEITHQQKLLPVVRKVIESLKPLSPNKRIPVLKAAAIRHGIDI